MSELNFIQSYKDLVNLIEQHKGIIKVAEEEIRYLEKQLHATEPHKLTGMNMGGQPKGNLSPISIDRCVEGIQRCKHLIEIEQEQIRKLEDKKEEIESKLSELEGLYFKVAVMRDIEGKNLKQIADELGYTEGYIKNISAALNM
jgi:DNA repair exonuclease SbcCD ATPase subunit